MLYTTMIMTFTVGVDLGFVLGCFLLIFYHIASMNKSPSTAPATSNYFTATWNGSVGNVEIEI